MPVRFRLKNFQAYEDAEVEVSGLTAVAGPNNGGKSALARAIRASFQNTPSAHLVRRGAPQMEVEVDLGDSRFTWGRDGGSKGRPMYRVGGATLYPGREVPPQVREAGIRSVEVGGEAVWPQFARQGESAFLVDRTGAYLAEAVCDPGRAELLAQAARLLESDRRSVRGRLSTAQEALRNARGWLAYLSPAESSAEEATHVPGHLARVEARLQEVERLQGLRDQITALAARARRLAGVRDLRLPHGDLLRELVARLDHLRAARDRLGRSARQCEALKVITALRLPEGEGLRDRVQRHAAVLRARDHIQHLSAKREAQKVLQKITLPDAQVLRSSLDRLRVLRSTRDHLRNAGERLRDARRDVEESRAALTLATRCRDEVVNDVGACPFCGSTAPNERRPETHSHDPTTCHYAVDGGTGR